MTTGNGWKSLIIFDTVLDLWQGSACEFDRSISQTVNTWSNHLSDHLLLKNIILFK